MALSTLTAESIAARRNAITSPRQVTFGVAALYGLSRESVWMPVNATEGIESGQVCITIDPESPPASNLGVIDYDQGKLVVRYGVQAVFPGLFQLITEGKHDPSLLNPVRCTATDECTLTPERSGWRALGCLDFLPGSLWAGATGG
jgi:hypothetical protein